MDSMSIHKFLCDNIPGLDKIEEFSQESDEALRRIADKEIVFAMRFWAIYRVFKDNLDRRNIFRHFPIIKTGYDTNTKNINNIKYQKYYTYEL